MTSIEFNELGQGYIWSVHRTPGSDTWELSMRSRQLWEELAESVERQGLNPLDELGWKKTGTYVISGIFIVGIIMRLLDLRIPINRHKDCTAMILSLTFHEIKKVNCYNCIIIDAGILLTALGRIFHSIKFIEQKLSCKKVDDWRHCERK